MNPNSFSKPFPDGTRIEPKPPDPAIDSDHHITNNTTQTRDTDPFFPRTFLQATAGAPPPMQQYLRDRLKKFDVSDVNSFGTIDVFKGLPYVQFSEDENTQMAHICKFTLIGKSSQGVPQFKTIHTKLKGFGFKGPIFIGVINVKHIMIRFSNEDDYMWMRTKQVARIHGYHMHLFKWTPYFDTKTECAIVPVWITLPKLPLHLFHEKALYSIVKLVRVPLKVDENTVNRSRPNVVRVCVEVDLLKPVHEEVYIGCGGHIVKQKIVYKDPLLEKCT